MKKSRVKAAPQGKGHRFLLPILALWGMALIAYSNSFQARLVYDSDANITQDSRVWTASAENVKALLTQDYWYRTRSSGLYRPLTKLSYLFNYAVLGDGRNPAGYHWINFALHAANMSLAFFLGLFLWEDRTKAFAAAAVWGLHPVLTEAVTNVVGRADLLATFGVLAGLLCHIRASGASGRRKAGWVSGLVCAAFLGLFSKESAVVLVAAMAIYDFTYRNGAPWRARFPSYVALALPFSIFLLARRLVLGRLYDLGFGFVQNPMVGEDFWTARLTALKVLGKYLWLLVWPSRLSCDYSYNQIPPGNWQAWAAVAACAGVAAIAIAHYRRNKPLFFWVMLFFAAMAPVSNLVIQIGTIMAERVLYLPSLGFAGGLALAIYALGARWPRARWMAPAALAVICCAYGARTYARNFDWSDEQSLWASAVQTCPDSYMTHIGLATSRMNLKGVDPESVNAELDRGLSILAPLPDGKNTSVPYAFAGAWYRARGDALAPSPAASLWYQQALATLLRGRRVDLVLSERIRRLNAARGKTLPYYSPQPTLYLELGRVYLRLGQPREALDALGYGRRLTTQPEFSHEMSNAYLALGDAHQAAIALQEGSLLAPAEVRFAPELASAYKLVDPQGCAVVSRGKQTMLNRDCPLVRADTCTAAENVARMYLEAGQPAQAAEVKRTGCRE